MSTRDEIIEGAARAFWVDAYARHVEGEGEACMPYEDGFMASCPAFGTHARPGPQQDWTDFAPPTGPEAFEKARELVKQIEYGSLLGRCLGTKFLMRYSPEDARLFGHYLAMEAMGHGVSWEDDHEPHGLRVPHMEFYV